MAARAGVAASAFYDVFPTIDDCYLTAFEDGLGRLSRAVEHAAALGATWLERVRAGVVGLLGFLDDEPRWGRLLLLEAPVSGRVALQCQQRVLAVLTALLETPPAGKSEEPGAVPPLTAELVAGAVLCIVRTRLVNEGETFVELAPSLLCFIAVQYGLPTLASSIEGDADVSGRAAEIARAGELPVRATRRTTLVLRAIAQAPYSNNREVAGAAGLGDEGQASKLLARLERQGVIENVGVGAARGEPNAWLLTASGQRAVELLEESLDSGHSRPRSPRGKRVA